MIGGLTDPEEILAYVENHFRGFGATHFLASGLPMPGREAGPLVLRLNWGEPDADRSSPGIDQDDVLMHPLCVPQGILVLRGSELADKIPGQSGLMNAAGGNDAVHVCIVPINVFPPYQAVVLAAGPSLDVPPAAMIPTKRLCIAAFVRLFAIEALKPNRPGDLSSRERRVVQLSAKGQTAGEIAKLLDISQRTVHAHLQNASTKLRGRNKTHTVVNALRYAQITI